MASHQEQIFDLLFNQDEITWQSIIYELVRENKMDPWDVDISLLAQRFVETLQTLKKMDFRISGKILLAAAILLRLKSSRFIDTDLAAFEQLMQSSEELAEEFYEELEHDLAEAVPAEASEREEFRLVPRTPQPRKRKVSVFDLVEALEKALEVRNRRISRPKPKAPRVEAPKDVMDISLLLDSVFAQIRDYYSSNTKRLSFTMLLPSQSKEDKVQTFIPLLHLTTQRKIDIEQYEHFGEIFIDLLQKPLSEPKANITA